MDILLLRTIIRFPSKYQIIIKNTLEQTLAITQINTINLAPKGVKSLGTIKFPKYYPAVVLQNAYRMNTLQN